jgi:hypothetical protein
MPTKRTDAPTDVLTVQARIREIMHLTLPSQNPHAVIEYSAHFAIAALIVAAAQGLASTPESRSRILERLVETASEALNEEYRRAAAQN